jgi:hypothetical protein
MVVGHGIVKRKSSHDTLQGVRAVTGGSDELSDANDVHAGFLLRVGILDEYQFGVSLEAGNFGELNVVIDALPVVLEMEARVLKGVRLFNNGLAEVLNLLLRRDLLLLAPIAGSGGRRSSYHGSRGVRLVGQLDGDLEDIWHCVSAALCGWVRGPRTIDLLLFVVVL